MAPPAHPPARRSAIPRSFAALVAGVSLTVLAAAAPAPAVAAPVPTPPAVPAPFGAHDPGSGEQPSAGRYIVTLREPAAATYSGGVAGKARTAPRDGEGLKAGSAPVKAYRTYLRSRQDDAARTVGARVISSYSAALNGFTAELQPRQVDELRADPTVVSVVKDDLRKPLAAVNSTDYLGLSGKSGVWAGNGGVEGAGKGVVVGVVDTGIAPENPSFSGAPLGTAPGQEPYLDGSVITYRKADGGTFTGACTAGVQFTAADCSTKLVSARYFVDNFGATRIGGPSIGEYLSPRDGEAHGSHTASTAAGANGVEADLGGVPMGPVSGVAPAAKVAAYKACWSGPDAKDTTDDGCATGDLLAAIDAAVADNVDVINYSIGSADGARTTDSVVDEAFRNAAASGIFVATAGGNSGPGDSTVDNASPWITTTAASTMPTREATVELGDGQNVLGASVSLPADGRKVSAPLVAASGAGTAISVRPQLCGPDSLDGAKVKGAIVLCERGTYDRAAKSAEVKRAGGIGMVLVNPSPDSTDLDTHAVPTIAVDADGYDALLSYAGTEAPTVTLVDGNPHHLASAAVPQIAGFSSRGPVQADGGDLIKPDLAAPGVAVLADGANAAGGRPSFTFMSGTSMASPHVAGLGALYLGLHPQATPAEIKSALMTTTRPTVTGAGEASEDVFAQGNGQVDATRYLHPGLLYLNGPEDWARYVAAIKGDRTAPAPSDLNLASIGVGSLAGRQTVTRTVTSTGPGTFTADPVQIPGVDTVVEPRSLTFTEAGQSRTFKVTFTRTTAPLGEYATGYLTWRGGGQSVRSALAVRPVTLVAPTAVAASGSTGRTTVSLKGGEDRDVPLDLTGLSRGLRVQGSGTVGGPSQTHVVEVPAGTEHARFALDAADDSADLDLSVYRLNQYGDTALVERAATESADEQLDLEDPEPGLYEVEVDFFAGSGPLGFTVTSFSLNDKGAEGSFTAQPATAPLRAGGTTPVTLSWKGLRAGAVYLGRVTYGDTGRTTYVTVTGDPRGGPPGGSPGTRPSVAVQPAYAVAGQSAVVVAKGLTPAVDFQIRVKGTNRVLASGRTTDDGGVGRLVTLPADIATGKQTLEVRYGSRSAGGSFTVAKLVLGDSEHSDAHAFDGNPLAAMTTAVRGKGTVRITVRGASGTYLSRTLAVDAGELGWYAWKSEPVETRPEKLTATLAVVADHGRTGQSTSLTWTPTAVKASSASITEDRAAAHTAKVSYTNNSEVPAFPTLRYKLTNGDLVLATLQADPEDTFTRSYDTTGVDRLDLVIDGTTVATYRNRDRAGLTGRPTMVEPFYTTFQRGGSAKQHGGTASLKMTVTNRPAAYSGGFALTVGEGPEIYAGTSLLLDERIPVPRSAQEGAPVSRTVTVPAGRPLWATAYYEVQGPIFQALAVRRILVPPVAAADLQPVRGSGSRPAFVVDTMPREAAAGTTASVTAAGLSPRERFTVRLDGRVVGFGRATAGGFAHAFVPVRHTHDRTLTVRVTGTGAGRSGETVLGVSG
ncbi:S8 family serine peptidase [Actinacidiphila glaucinigra]|uniref:S8 family serine peptidase n=1 Tax=Actinacidiphila glaucinigra TaxID=235986 RepID=UPI003252DFFF